MRVLLVNDQLVCSGTELQVLREKRVLEEQGHQVLLMTFDRHFPRDDTRYTERNGFVNFPVRRSRVSSALRRAGLLRVRPLLKARIAAAIRRFDPEVVHAHNLYTDPITVFAALEPWVTVQTLRDYRAVCPVGTCIRPDGSVCAGHAHNDCWHICGAVLKRRSRLGRWRAALASRLATVQAFVTPSKKLAEFCASNGIPARCVNNPFDFVRFGAMRKRTDFASKKYLFYGTIAEVKGIFRLLDAFEIFQRGKDVELLVAGPIEESVREQFEDRIADARWAQYLGVLENDAMLEVLATTHTIVVPSVWMENYPNTVLEGMALGVLVTGSNRGGIPEMIPDAPQFTFDVDNLDAIVRTLEMSHDLSETDYHRVTEANRKRVEERNAVDRFYREILACFERARADRRMQRRSSR